MAIVISVPRIFFLDVGLTHLADSYIEFIVSHRSASKARQASGIITVVILM